MVRVLKEIKRVFKDTVVYGMGSLLPKAAGFLLLPLYTRLLSTADYGVYSLSTMIASMVGVVMLLGQNGALTLHLRRRVGEEGDTRDLAFTVTVFVLVFGGAVFALLYTVGPALIPFISKSGEFTFSPYVVLALMIAFAGLPLALLQAANRARGQAKVHTAFQLSQFALNTGFTIFFLVVLRQGAAGSLKGTLVAALIVAPVALFFLAREMRPRFSVTWLRSSLKFGLPLVPHYFAGWLLTFADRALLSRLGTMSAVGLYAVAYNISMILNLFSTAINQAWAPIYYDLSDSEKGRAMLPRLTTVYASAVAAVAMAFTLFAPEVLLITDPAFWAANRIVPVVAAGYFFFAMYMVVSTPIFYARKTRFVPLISGAAAVLNVVLNIWWIPTLGIMGAALATLIAYAVMAAVARAVSGRMRPGAFENGRMVKVVLIYLCSLAVSMLIVSSSLPFAARVAIEAAAYAGLLLMFLLTGVTTRDEVLGLWKRFVGRRSRKADRPVEEVAAMEASDAEVLGNLPDTTGLDPDERR